MDGELLFGGERIRYEVRFLASRRTLGIEVHPDSRVLVRAPLGCPSTVVAERVQRRAGWISRQLAEFDRFRPRTPARRYVSGESHLYLGRQYRLKVEVGSPPGVRLTRGQMAVRVQGSQTPAQVKAVLHRWYLDRARALFSELLDASAARLEITERPKLVLRTMHSRWGSLSQGGRMTLNLALVRAPRSCIEYVVTHELCHIGCRDHSARFFRLLDGAMPDWKQRKQRLELALL